MAFGKVKDELCEGFAVRLHNPDIRFVRETEGRIQAIGTVILKSDAEEEYPRIFYSQAITAAHRDYSTYERELFAVVKACDAFRVYLLGREFTLRTDHAVLSAIFDCPGVQQSRCEVPPNSSTFPVQSEKHQG